MSAAWPELTFHVADWAGLTLRRSRVPYGAREHLVDGDVTAAIVSELAALVHRLTGALDLVNYVGDLERMSVMEPAGHGHPAN